MDEETALPEDRFQALMGRVLRREDRERLGKVRKALGIRANDAVWDVMIAMDYHLQLYSAVPRELAAQREKLVADLRGLAGTSGQESRGARGGSRSRLWPFCGESAVRGASAVAFGAICIAAGYSMAARGRPPWGAARPLGHVLGAPAGWLIFLLLLPVASRWVRAGWAAARSHEGHRVRLFGWALLVVSIGLIAAGLWLLNLALRR
jgi:hypothetical protein